MTKRLKDFIRILNEYESVSSDDCVVCRLFGEMLDDSREVILNEESRRYIVCHQPQKKLRQGRTSG